MRPSPRFSKSVEIHRPTIGADGRLVFSGTPASTVSGAIFQRRLKVTVAEGESYQITATAFLPAGTDLRRRDHLKIVAPAAVSGQRFLVVNLPSAIDDYGVENHVGAELQDAEVTS
jgi:hypothetical protein